jgi:HPt (histidine-containing phosphotransfer) domain-containing protein
VRALDPAIAGQLAASLPEAEFQRLLRTFEADLGRLADDYGRAAAAEDSDGLRRAAHSLAGAAAAIGAGRLEAAARSAMEGQGTADTAGQIRDEAAAALAALAALSAPVGQDGSGSADG